MSNKQIITIAGRPGSGKSSTAKTVAERLGYDHFSSGDLFRSLAKERGIDLLQANLSSEENDEIDQLVDRKLREIGKTQDRIVLDSRTAWHWIPDSFKVYLDLDLDVAAERILQKLNERSESNENIPTSPEEYTQILRERLASESRRYKALYDIDPNNLENYDLVVDTKVNDLEKVVDIIIEAYNN